MYCNKCGKQIMDGSAFCNYCGAKIKQPISEECNVSLNDLIIISCKECIEKHLKAPSTVNYVTIEIRDQDDYGRVYLYVELDAQNAFGAYIRNKLHVVLQSINDDGTYEALNEAVYKASFINTEDVVKRINRWNKPK